MIAGSASAKRQGEKRAFGRSVRFVYWDFTYPFLDSPVGWNVVCDKISLSMKARNRRPGTVSILAVAGGTVESSFELVSALPRYWLLGGLGWRRPRPRSAFLLNPG